MIQTSINYHKISRMIVLEAARVTYNKPDSKFEDYRKLILDAGVAVLKIKED